LLAEANGGIEPTTQVDPIEPIEPAPTTTTTSGGLYTDEPDLWVNGGDAYPLEGGGLTYIPSTYDQGGMAFVEEDVPYGEPPEEDPMALTGEPDPIIQVPPSPGPDDLVGTSDPNPPLLQAGAGGGVATQAPGMPDDTTIQDLYPTDPGVVAADPVNVPDPTGATVTEADLAVGDVGVPGVAADSTGRITGELDTGGGGITAEQTTLTPEQQVDMELARILEQDSPLMQRARQEAARAANRRGLQNTSMAMGMAEGALVDRALPMAAQNAQQALQRELDNTLKRQEAAMFTAEQQNQLMQIEATLGQELNIYNADQLNEAARLTAQLQTALEQGNQQAYNEASMQLAQLSRDAEAQQADIEFKQNQAVADARNALNAQIMDNVTQINKQFLVNMGAADLANINGTYNVLIQTNATAGQIYDGALSAMAAVMDDPDMTPSQVSTALAHIQTTLEASMRMVAEINDYDWTYPPGGAGGGGTGGGGGGGGPACFEAGTCFRMADGTIRKIENIKAKDEMALGGRVYFAISGDGTQETWFDVDGIKVSGSHAMKKDGVWMRVRDAGYEQVETVDTFYTLINEDHRMVAENGQVFADYDEVDLDDTGWHEYAIDRLNGEDEKFMQRGKIAA
jgi:hypothetical protein